MGTSRTRSVALPGAVLLALALACAAPAQATVTFGAGMATQATLSFQCSVPPPFFGPYRPPSPNAPPDTCTALTAGNFGGGGTGSHLVPEGNGVITKIRVHMPPRNFDSAAGAPNNFSGPWRPLGQTGPLRITVLRAERSPGASLAICCTVTSESAPFVPAQQDATGTISEFSLEPPLPVHAVTTVTCVYEFEGLAVTAVDATSIIPAGGSGTASSGAYFPAARPGQERFESQATLGTADGINQGTQVLLQADWEPVVEPPAPTPTPAPGPVVTPPVTTPVVTPVTPGAGTPAGAAAAPAVLRRTTATVNRSRGTAGFPVRCDLATTCQARLTLRRARTGSRALASASTSYGTGSAKIPAGKQATVTVKLNRAGKALVRKRRSVKVTAVLTVDGKTATRSVTLRRAG